MNITLGEIEIPVEVCATPEKIKKGLQGRDSLDGGMLFFLDGNHHSFWMKDCNFPIDILFILDNKVNEIYPNCQPCSEEPCERFEGRCDYVLELNSGFCEKNNIKKGEPFVIPL